MDRKKQTPPKITPAWISDSLDAEPVVLSTRVRLARNLQSFPFPHRADSEILRQIAQKVSSAASDKRAAQFRLFSAVDVAELTDTQKAALVDSHLVSLLHVVSGPNRVALLDQRHTNSILINEEDHIRIQTILPGLMPHEAWLEADKIDDALSKRLQMAYDDTYGYLTASLANSGTGLRISVMVHLPALAFIDKLKPTWNAANVLGATVRGIYGEDGASHGHVYQVSNATSVGNERGIVGKLTSVAIFLQSEETVARHILRTRRLSDIQVLVDATMKKLESAAALTVEEAMGILSNLRLGEMMGIKTSVSHKMFCEMMASMRGSVGLIANKTDRARDVFYEDTRRPASVRNRLRKEKSTASATRPPLGLA